jgi:homoserine O-acetyltransferase/O-succinyltransferase
MKKIILILFVISVFAGNAQQQFADLGTLKLVSGDSISGFRIGFRTFGEMNEERSNVILFPAWFNGTSEQLKSQVGENKPLDSTKYFIIAVDPPGNGVSTSPSNYGGDKNKFPLFTLEDAVNSQYLLLSEHFNLNHIFAVYGGSMGGMQVFQWVTLYPSFMDKAIAYVGTPKLSASDHLLWNAQLSMVEAFKKSELTLEEAAGAITFMQNFAAYTTAYTSRTISTDTISSYVKRLRENFAKRVKFEDYGSQLRAMLEHDVMKRYNNSFAETAAAITTDILIIVASKDQMVNPANSIELATHLKRKAIVLENDCGHLAPGCEYDNFIKLVRDFLDTP